MSLNTELADLLVSGELTETDIQGYMFFKGLADDGKITKQTPQPWILAASELKAAVEKVSKVIGIIKS